MNVTVQSLNVSYDWTEACCHWDENKHLCDHLLMVNNSMKCVRIGCQYQEATEQYYV